MGKRVSLAEELKPIMFFARVMGAAPYTIKNNIYKISPGAFFYTMTVNIANFIVVLMSIDEIRRASRNTKLDGLSYAITVFSLSPIILNTLYAFLHRRESSEIFNIVNKFDALINLRPSTKKHFATIWAFMLSSIVMGAICVVAKVYQRSGEDIIMLNRFLMTARNTTSIGFFLSMLCSMLRRFQEINRIIERDSKDLDMNDVVLRRSMGLRKVWILYDQLMEATEKLNSLYSAELLIWILMASIVLLRRLHIQWNHYEIKPIDILIGGITITMFIMRLLYLTWFCHKTASMLSVTFSFVANGQNVAIALTTFYFTRKGILINARPSMTRPRQRTLGPNPSYAENPMNPLNKRRSNFRSVWPPAFRSYLSPYHEAFHIFIRQRHANNVAAEAFRVNSRVLKMNRSWDDEDTFVIGQYFLLRRSFQITAGGGFLRVNLPLLRTIVGTIVTYLVILRSPGEKRQGA